MPLRDLAALVVKDRVSLGGLSEAHRGLALGLAWSGLPTVGAFTERQINESLKAQLAGPVACLDTDHVELRRWLVDAGWLARDGYGREYRRVTVGSLPAAQRVVAEALDGIDAGAWVADLRRSHQVRREARHAEWQAAGGVGR